MLKILLIGDIQIGRRPGRLPGNLGDYGLSVSEVTPPAPDRALAPQGLSEASEGCFLVYYFNPQGACYEKQWVRLHQVY